MKTFNLSSSIPSAYLSFSFLAAIFLFSQEIFAQDKTIPGEVTTPYPTLINLAVEWIIQGEDNQNGIVNIQFREKGNKKWEQGMPLRRVPAGENVGFKCVNKHSGSIFDLKPDTEYEIKLNLEDPDGGSAEKTVVTRTRSVPVIEENAEIIEIQPGKYDTLLVKNGTAEKPIVYRCSKGEAIYKYIDLRNRKWVFIEGLTIINPAPHGKGISLNGAANCVVRRCSIDAVYGIVAYKPGATNCYFSDNVITGTCEWTNEAMGANGKNIEEGIEITGPGNVICYNKVTGFRDYISTMLDQGTVNQVCIDIYNNDIYRGVDVGNDANMMTIAEHRFGAAKGFNNIIFVALRTWNHCPGWRYVGSAR